MIARIVIGVFASTVASVSYLTGLGRLMTGLLVGFGACGALFFGVLFVLPVDAERRLFPVYEPVPAWPFFCIGLALAGLTALFYLYRTRPVQAEPVGAQHFKAFAGGMGGYLASLFLSSVFWFPSDETRRAAAAEGLFIEVLFGTVFFLAGVSVSCYLLYRASKGVSAAHPDLMRRFVLAVFTLFQLDKVPLLVAYLLIYAPETQVVFPNLAALALLSYFPVAALLIKTSWDSADQ